MRAILLSLVIFSLSMSFANELRCLDESSSVDLSFSQNKGQGILLGESVEVEMDAERSNVYNSIISGNFPKFTLEVIKKGSAVLLKFETDDGLEWWINCN